MGGGGKDDESMSLTPYANGSHVGDLIADTCGWEKLRIQKQDKGCHVVLAAQVFRRNLAHRLHDPQSKRLFVLLLLVFSYTQLAVFNSVGLVVAVGKTIAYTKLYKNQQHIPHLTGPFNTGSPRQLFTPDPYAPNHILMASSSSSYQRPDDPQARHQIERHIVDPHQIHADLARDVSQSSALSTSSHRTTQDQSRTTSSPPAMSAPSTYKHRADLYMHNSLKSFSFGTVQPSPGSQSRPINPLSPDDSDTEESQLPADVTPRPSVSHSYHPQRSPPRSHPAQPPGIPPAHRIYRSKDPDTSSRHAFGHSFLSQSASASVTSFSSTSHSNSNSRAGSRAANYASNTIDYDDDDEDHRHPIPPHLHPHPLPPDLPPSSSTDFTLSSDEEYESEYDYEYDSYYDDGGIEISSAMYEGSVSGTTHEWDRAFYAYENNGSGGSVRTGERRGSLPMAIPGADTGSIGTNDGFYGRDREDSRATIRRPSRSLDDDFGMVGILGAADGANRSDRPLPKPPVNASVPESDGDWKSLREKQKGKEKDKNMLRGTPLGGPSSTTYKRNQNNEASTASFPSAPNTNSAMEGFDLDWSQLQNGITMLDTSEVADIIRAPNSGPPLSPTASRRPSAWRQIFSTPSNVDSRRPSANSSVYGGDSFGKAVGRWGGDGYLAQRRDWSFRREKADRRGDFDPVTSSGGRSSITGFLSPRGSMATERSMGAFGTSGINPGSRDGPLSIDDQDKANKKSKAPTAVWRGMQLDAQEVWKNDMVGRFKVERRCAKAADPSKGPQQRLMVQHFRDPYAQVIAPHNGPPVTIHKHSKAVAFSICRIYRHRIVQMRPKDNMTSSSISGIPTSRDGSGTRMITGKRSSSMILLAPRRVQEAFTSTTTTRRLESHGLLDERIASDDTSSRERERRRDRDKKKAAEEAKLKAKKKAQKGDPPIKPGTLGESSSQSSSIGSVAGGTTSSATSLTFVPPPPLPPPPASAPTLHTYPPRIQHCSSSDRNTSRASSRNSRRRRGRDPLDDDDSDGPPSRTPHSETYGTMDASLIEQLRPGRDRHHHISDLDTNRGFLKRFIRGRGLTASLGSSVGQLEPYYEPPWLVLASRNKQEQQQRFFKDVGLLPSTHKDKRHGSSSQKHKKSVISGVPSDCLYMLLPLWPGDTDPMFQKPPILSEQRQYLLVYYKSSEPTTTDADHSRSKQRSRGSPTSSHDSIAKRDDRSILLNSFHVSARLISYNDLQGTGVRVPDEGLTVTGPLDVAFNTMPAVREDDFYECVLAVCNSREAGVEFYPEGLVKLGLCLLSPAPPDTIMEDGEPPEPIIELTPVGRAVIEMAWLGCMALTSFGPGT
ncbi:hypothetical protein BD779DRAFT_1506481 [Infundibulicybe gibba]|nr:hypothetical protein BD779DRAFT_1506481 [Infundibulicybe gibba]